MNDKASKAAGAAREPGSANVRTLSVKSKAAVYETLRDSLSRSGLAYAEVTHGRIDDFVDRMEALVLGKPPAAGRT